LLQVFEELFMNLKLWLCASMGVLLVITVEGFGLLVYL
jgi:hypothetical protein